MKIIIVGDGKVGYTLSQQLAQEGHDITIIDNNAHTLNETMETLDVIGVLGNGASHDVQLEAGVPGADLLIAATSSDELNMICCLTAKHSGAKRTIARVRNPEYRTQLRMLQEQFGLSLVINPEYETAREIARVINFPPALKIDTFAKGRVELVEFRLTGQMSIVGKKLKELPRAIDAKVLICAVEREGKVYIPGGDFVLLAGDRLHITGQSRDISSFIYKIGQIPRKLRTLLIVGGGRICYYLTKMLDDRAYEIKIVEKDRDRCNELCDLLPKAVIIHADGSDGELLESEGLEDVDALVALTNIDEQNLIMSMLAAYKKVPKIITKIAHFNYLSIIEKMGIDSVVNPKVTTANQICQYVRSVQNSEIYSNIKTLHKLVGGKAEAVEFNATETTHGLGTPFEQLHIKRNLLVASIVRGEKVIIPHGGDCIVSGDSVIVVTNEHVLTQLNDIFEKM